MTLSSTEPEYIVEESEKTHLTERKLDSSDRNYLEVVADLAKLYQEVSTCIITLEGIRGSLAVLVESLEVQ